MTTTRRIGPALLPLLLAAGIVLGACADGGSPPDAQETPRSTAAPPVVEERGSCEPTENETTLLDVPTDPPDVDETFEVVSHDLEVTDSDRDRVVTVRVRFPEDATSSLPAVVISHDGGGEGAERRMASLGDDLAAHGYLVLNPNHSSENGRFDRPADVSFLVDRLEADDLEIPGFSGTTDAQRVASVGVGLGASTTLVLAGATTTVGNDTRCFSDDRIDAFVALSPAGAGQFGFTEDSWAGLRGPYYAVAGDEDLDTIAGGPDEGETVEGWRRESFDAVRPGHAYLSILPGVEQRDFTVAEGEEGDTQAFVDANVRAFLDTYLRGVDRADEIGSAGDLADVTDEER